MQRFLILIILLSLFSCSSNKDKSSGSVVAVSIQPQKYLVSAIADTLLEVVVMVPPGASPATWEATPSQMKSLHDAQIYFQIGHIGFEKAWMDRIKDLNDEMKIVDLSVGLSLLNIDMKHGDHSHTGIDPHTWMSPLHMESMARTIYHELSAIWPEHKDMFLSNYEKLRSEIKSVNGIMKKQLAPYSGNSFLIFHPSLGYLAKDYGLQQYSLEYEGKEPSPAHMKEIIELARNNDIKVIFVQEEFDKRNAGVVANEIGGIVIQVNPLSEDWPKEMRSISNKLLKSFK
jgi:zinc transport system substrate-binding protein